VRERWRRGARRRARARARRAPRGPRRGRRARATTTRCPCCGRRADSSSCRSSAPAPTGSRTHVPEWATLCNARGSRDVPVAEWVVGALLGHRDGPPAGRRAAPVGDGPPAELGDWTVVSLGHGSIGRAVEERLAPFGTRIAAWSAAPATACTAPTSCRSSCPGRRPGGPAAADRRHPRVASTPRRSPACRRAVVVNAGRGAVIDAAALRDEVCSGRLRAVLDVTDPEPLPEDDPLVARRRGTLAITGHHAGTPSTPTSAPPRWPSSRCCAGRAASRSRTSSSPANPCA
jgi:hypothetical protein